MESVKLLRKDGTTKDYVIEIYNSASPWQYIRQSMNKSIIEKRIDNEFVIGGYYNGEYYGDKLIKKQPCDNNVSFKLKKINKTRLIKILSDGYVLYEIHYTFKDIEHIKLITINTNEFE